MADAGVVQIASKYNIECIWIPKNKWADASSVLSELRNRKITHIILAGFLLLIPKWLIAEFKGQILNIHPALLPKYGGKGMYGHHIHEKIKSSGDLISGITIHEVNEDYDDGKIIFQESISLSPEDSAFAIGKKVLQLEHYYYPRIIEEWVLTFENLFSG